MFRGKFFLTVFAVACCGFTAWLIYWSETVLEPPATPAPETAGPREGQEMFPERLDSFETDSEGDEVEEVATLETPDLAIEGFVFVGGKLQGEGSVAIGEESVPIQAGVFKFAAIERPRFGTVTFALAGAEPLNFEWTLIDAAEESDEPLPDLDSVTQERAFDLVHQSMTTPQRLRWTLTFQSETEEPESDFWIAPKLAFAEDWGLGGRVRVRGNSNLPDGARIYATFNFDRIRTLSSFRGGAVREGRWEDLVPSDQNRHLYAGRYELHSSFNLRLENSEVIDSWPEDVFKRIDATATELLTTAEVVIGSPAESKAEDRVEQNYYCPLIADLNAAYAALKTRLKEVRRYGIGINPTLLEASKTAHAAWFHEPLIATDGGLDREVWRNFLDREFRPAIREQLETHRNRKAKYVEAQQRVDGSLDSLHRLSYLYSQIRVYGALGIRQHPNDEYESGSAALGEITILETRIEDDLAELRRFCFLVPATDG